MANLESIPTNTDNESELRGETSPRPTSFVTAKGSRYTYDADGKTTRFKTVTGEQQPRQDITVFASLTPNMEQDILDAIHLEPSPTKPKAYVVERTANNMANVIRDVGQVQDPDQLNLVLTDADGAVSKVVPATLMPAEGLLPFDMRTYTSEAGQRVSERHLGNPVIQVNYD